jgi:hypothetical protein
MAQYRRSAILRVEKLVHEDMYGRTKRVNRKIANIFSKSEQRKGRAEGHVGKGGLHVHHIIVSLAFNRQSQC